MYAEYNLCSCTHASPSALYEPMLPVVPFRALQGKASRREGFSYAHGGPRVQSGLSAGHSGCPLSQGHEDDELVLHPAGKVWLCSALLSCSLNPDNATILKGIYCRICTMMLARMQGQA